MEDKTPRYIVSLSNGETYKFTEQEYKERENDIYNEDSNAQVARINDYDFDKEIDDKANYVISDGEDTFVMTGKEYRDRFDDIRNTPGVQVGSLSVINDYWDRKRAELANIQAQIDEQTKRRKSAQDAYNSPENNYDFTSEDIDPKAATDAARRSMEAKKNLELEDKMLSDLYDLRRENPAYQRDIREIDAASLEGSERSEELLKEARKGREMDEATAAMSGPVFKNVREGIAKILGTEEGEFYEERDALTAAKMFYDEARRIINSPDRSEQSNGLVNIFKGLWDGKEDLVPMIGLTLKNIPLAKTVEKIQKEEGTGVNIVDLVKNHPENMYYLTRGEKELMEAFILRSSAEAVRNGDVSLSYQAAQSFENSLGYMVDFAITKNVGKSAVGKISDKLINAAARMSVNAGLKGGARKAVLADIKFAIGTVESAIKAAIRSPYMASSYKNLSDALLQVNEAGQIDLSGQAILDEMWDSVFIENFSEYAGAQVGGILGAAMKPIKWAGEKTIGRAIKSTRFEDIGKLFSAAKSTNVKLFKDAAFDGFLGEYGEEWYGNLIRVISGVDDNALADFVDADQQIITLGSFAPLSVFGFGTNAARHKMVQNRVKNAGTALKEALERNRYDEETIKNVLAVGKAESPKQLADGLAPVVKQIVKDNPQDRAAIKAVYDYAYSVAQLRTFDGITDAEIGAERDQMEQEISASVGSDNWIQEKPVAINGGKEEVPLRSVRTMTDQSGHEFYVQQEDEQGFTAVDREGNKKFIEKASVDAGEYQDSGRMPLRDYLDMELTKRKDTADAERVQQEAVENKQQLLQQALPGVQVNLGTEETPIAGTIVQTDGNTWIVQSSEGKIKQYNAEEMANLMNLPLVPVTEKQQEEADAEKVERLTNLRDQANAMKGRQAGGATLIHVSEPLQQQDGSVVFTVTLENEQGAENVPMTEEELSAFIAEAQQVPVVEVKEEAQPEQKPTDGTPLDFRGNPLPMRTNKAGERVVAENTLWNNDPEAWAHYNDNNPNRKVDSKKRLEENVKSLAKEIEKDSKEIEKAAIKGIDEDVMDDMDASLNEKTKRLGLLKSLLDQYNAPVEGGQTIAGEQRRQEAEKVKQEQKAGFPGIQQRWNESAKGVGAADEIRLPNGETVTGHYVLTDAMAPTPSHNPAAGFAMSEGFPVDENGKTVNDRDYEQDKAAQQSVLEKAASYDQRALQTPVIVTSDGVVLSGNDRTMASQIAAAQNTDKAYTDYLSRYSQKYGFTHQQVAQFEHPRVVFVTDEAMPYNAATFAKFNAEEKKSQNKTEKAVKAGKTVTPETLGALATLVDRYEDINALYNDEAGVDELLNILLAGGIITKEQVAALKDGETLSGTGMDLLESTLIGSALDESAVRLAMADKSIRKSLVSAIAQIITGNTLEGYTLRTELSDAIQLLAAGKSAREVKFGESVQSYVRQQHMFVDNVMAEATVQMLADAINSKKTSFLKKVLSLYNRDAVDAVNGQMNLLTGDVLTRDAILRNILEYLDYDTSIIYDTSEREGDQAESAPTDEGAPEEQNAPSVQGDAGSTAGVNAQFAREEAAARLEDGGVGEYNLADMMTDEEIAEFNKLYEEFLPANDALGEAYNELSDDLKSSDKKKKAAAQKKIDALEQAQVDAFAPVQSFVDQILAKYGLNEEEFPSESEEFDEELSDTQEFDEENEEKPQKKGKKAAKKANEEEKPLFVGKTDEKTLSAAEYTQDEQDQVVFGGSSFTEYTSKKTGETIEIIYADDRRPIYKDHTVRFWIWAGGEKGKYSGERREGVTTTDWIMRYFKANGFKQKAADAKKNENGYWVNKHGVVLNPITIKLPSVKKGWNSHQEVNLAKGSDGRWHIGVSLSSSRGGFGSPVSDKEDKKYSYETKSEAIRASIKIAEDFKKSRAKELKDNSVEARDIDNLIKTLKTKTLPQALLEEGAVSSVSRAEIVPDEFDNAEQGMLFGVEEPAGTIEEETPVAKPKAKKATKKKAKEATNEPNLLGEVEEEDTEEAAKEVLDEIVTLPGVDTENATAAIGLKVVDGKWRYTTYVAADGNKGSSWGGLRATSGISYPSRADAIKSAVDYIRFILDNSAKKQTNKYGETFNEAKQFIDYVVKMEQGAVEEEKKETAEDALGFIKKALDNFAFNKNTGRVMRTAFAYKDMFGDEVEREIDSIISDMRDAGTTREAQYEMVRRVADLYNRLVAPQTEASEPAAPAKAEEAPKAPEYGSQNKLVTTAQYEELKKRMQEKLGQLNAGFDPETFFIGAQMAMYHIEAGARKFIDFSQRMIKDLGDGIRPYLKAIYNGARDLPGMEELKKEMTPASEVDTINPETIGVDYEDWKKRVSEGDVYGNERVVSVNLDSAGGVGMITTRFIDSDGGATTSLPNFYKQVFGIEPEVKEEPKAEPVKEEAKQPVVKQVDVNALLGAVSDMAQGKREEVKISDFAEPVQEETTVEEETAEEQPSETSGQLGEIGTYTHTKTGEQMYIVRLTGDRLSAQEFKELKAKAKELGGYYSSFGNAKGFLFDTEENAKIFNNSNNYESEQTDKQTAADTAAVVSKAASVAEQAQSLAEAEAIGAEAAAEAITNIDDALEEVNDQLALLGFYEADQTGPFHESYGYMKSAEKKAVKDADKLAKKLAADLGIDVGRKQLAKANIAPAGGDVYFRLPLNEGRELYVTISVAPNGYTNGYGYSDDLAIGGVMGKNMAIMYRVENPSATGWEKYGGNNFAPYNVTYADLLKRVRSITKDYLPESPLQSAGTTDLLEVAKNQAEKSRKSNKKSVSSQENGDQMLGGLFADLDVEEESEPNVTAPKSEGNVAPRVVNGYAIGEKVIYTPTQGDRKPVEATIYDFEYDGRPVLDTGLAPVLYEVVDWEQVQKIENEPVNDTDNGLQGNDAVRTEGDSDNVQPGGGTTETEGRTGEEPGQDSGRADTGRTGGSQPTGRNPRHRYDDSVKRNTRNNHVSKGEVVYPTTTAARFKANIAAIRLLKELQDTGKQATKEQMAVLRQFTGWGGMGGYFNNEYSQEHRELKALLTDEEMEAAELSINTAYYTPVEIIDTMWDVAKRLGFEGGNILEGSAGIGNILASMPKSMSEQSEITAVELDSITGGILEQLYPDANVQIKGFQQVDIPNGSVDLAITNVPFGDINIYDEKEKDLSRKFGGKIHDFCIAKNVRKLADGGIGIFISTRGTLDNGSKTLRQWIVNEGNADVIGAFRLNNATFEGTKATSDIIVIRKRVSGEKSPNAIDVTDTTITRREDYNTGEREWNRNSRQYEEIIKKCAMEMNDYFVEHPENMGGEMGFGYEHGDTYRPASSGLWPTEKIDQNKRLAKWAKQFSDMERVELSKSDNKAADVAEETTGVKEGQLITNSKGDICVSRSGKAVPLAVNNNKVKGYSKKQVLADYDAIKQAINDVLDYQIKNESDEGLKPLLDKLNKAYDLFKRRYDRLNKNTAISFLRNDVDFPSVAAVEDYKEKKSIDGKVTIEVKKSDIFGGRVLGAKNVPTPKDAKDGVIVSMNQYGRIDIPFIAQSLGKSEQEVRDEILSSGLGYENPETGNIEVEYEYLSGNVRQKLDYARNHNVDGKYDKNISALEKAVPADIPAHLIEFSLGSDWMPTELYTQYAMERFGLTDKFVPANLGGVWRTDASEWEIGARNEQNRAAGVSSDKLNMVKFGHELMLSAMNNASVVFSKTYKDYDGTSHTETDKEATQAATNKMSEMRDDFKEWCRAKMLENPELAERISKTYNDTFNAIVPKTISDTFVPERFEGQVLTMGKDKRPFHLYPHQSKAVIRATTEPLMMAHEVGAGKTFTLITSAMEMRRLGTAKKPMIVVQNATLGQFVSSAKELYPNAKVLTITEADRTVEGRGAFYAKIKYNDWDMIIVPQSVFEMIPDSEERKRAFIQEKIDEKLAIMEQAKAAKNDTAVRELKKEIEDLQYEYNYGEKPPKKGAKKDSKKDAEAKENAKVKAQKQLDRKVDDVADFDEMGIDALLIDEAHAYKHLGFATSMQRGVKGVDSSYSKKSAGVYLKTRSIFDRVGWKNVVFATGTPISNTAAEIWTFMKYLMRPDVMKQNHIYYFDDFVRNFGNISQNLEFTTSGKFKENTRFASYTNLPELVRIWSSVTDTVLAKDAAAAKAADGTVVKLEDKLPKMEDGKAQDIYLPQSPSLVDIMNAVRAKLEWYDSLDGKEKKENSHIPLTMYGIAKMAAIDPRLVDKDAPDEPMSKTNRAVDEIVKALDDSKKYKGTAAIFCDNFRRWDYDDNGKRVEGFNIFEEIKRKLIARGVPADQIVIIAEQSTAAKEKIFDKVNAGDIRVIMGSTAKLGTGVNIQERLFFEAHLDAPNRPMDYTQRMGRILRQGNLHKDWGIPVRVVRFGVEDSLDVTAYQRLSTKSKFINSVMDSKPLLSNSMDNRVLEEEEDGVFDDPVAVLSGSEYAMLKSAAERELRKLRNKKEQHRQDQIYIEKQLKENNRTIEYDKKIISEDEGYLDKIKADFPDGKVKEITIEGKKATTPEQVAELLKEKISVPTKTYIEQRRNNSSFDSSTLKYSMSFDGVPVILSVNVTRTTDYDYEKHVMKATMRTTLEYSCNAYGIEDRYMPGGYVAAKDVVEEFTKDIATGKMIEDAIKRLEGSIARLESDNELMQERRGKPFADEEKLQKQEEIVADYTEKMRKELEEKEKKYAEIAKNTKTTFNVDKVDVDIDDDEEESSAEYSDTDTKGIFSGIEDRKDGESAKAFTERVVSAVTEKYPSLSGKIVIMTPNLTKEEAEKLPNGRFTMKHKKIIIFAKENRTSADAVERTILHEAIHMLIYDFGWHKDKQFINLFNISLVASGYYSPEEYREIFNDVKASYEERNGRKYTNEEIREEMVTFELSQFMLSGLAEEYIKGAKEFIPDLGAQLDKIVNTLGYEPTKESESRMDAEVLQEYREQRIIAAQQRNAGRRRVGDTGHESVSGNGTTAGERGGEEGIQGNGSEGPALDEEGVFYEIVTDPETIERLERGEKEYGYRTVVLNPDGSFSSPKASKLGKKGEKSRKTASFFLKKWEGAEENPDLATDEGKINLVDSVGEVDYNPYIHIRPDAINKQFTAAWRSPRQVYIQTAYPKSELTSGYKAVKAKLSVGRHAWNNGDLILSRWDKPERIVSWEEVADQWEKEFKETGVTFDIVNPGLLPVLASRGVEILPPKKAAGAKAMDAYNKWRSGVRNRVAYHGSEQVSGDRGNAGGQGTTGAEQKWRAVAADLVSRYENQNGEDKPWLSESQFIDLVERELPRNADTAALFDTIEQYRNLSEEDFNEGRRDFAGGEMSDVFKDILDMLQSLANGVPVRNRAAWHGSGAKFDSFDSSHMGEGEGAQAHGWGHYVTVDENVARNYAYRMGGTDEQIERAIGSISGQIVSDELRLRNAKTDMERRYYEDAIAASRRRIEEMKNSRHIYTVDIPEDTGENYINEQKELTKNQRNIIAEALRALPEDAWKISADEAMLFKDHTAESLANSLSKRLLNGYEIYAELNRGLGSKRAASEFLSNAGFVGIKYNGGVDGPCAVIFKDDDVKIVQHDMFREGGLYESSPYNYNESLSGKQLAASETARKAGVEIEFRPSARMTFNGKPLAGRWINGKIQVCLEHCRNTDDAVRTVLHEGVGHNGLRRLIGNENMTDFCMEAYRMLPADERRKIAEAAMNKYGQDFAEATEEYLAERAENLDFENEDYERNFWDELVAALRRILAKIGINVSLTQRDVRWLLWQSYNANRQTDVLNEAKRQVVANKLGFTLRQQADKGEAIQITRNRIANESLAPAANLYNRSVLNWMNRLHESWVDKDNSVGLLVEAIENATGRKAETFEDIRYALNQQSSKGLAAIEKFERECYVPMQDAVLSLMKEKGCDLKDVERYTMLKHALERNETFAKRDARAYYQDAHDQLVKMIKESDKINDVTRQALIAKEDAKLASHLKAVDEGTDIMYKEYRKQDYGGLTAMYSDYDTIEPFNEGVESEEEYQARVLAARHPKYTYFDASGREQVDMAATEDAARAEVAEFEDGYKNETDELWKRINKATKATLKHQYDANMLSRSQYEKVRDMFNYYIPLRGFADATAEDMYDYYQSDQRKQFTPPLLAAKGRKTEAESPFGYIGSMASSAIAADMKNETKLALYYFVSNRADNDLVNISEVWYEKTGEDEDGKSVYEPVYPPLSEDLSSEKAKDAYNAWEKSMEDKAKAGLAFKGRKKLNLHNSVVHIDNANKAAHVITFKVGGKDMMMYINGNPRAAQAINNELNVDASKSEITKLLLKGLRLLSGLNTQYNPEFWLSNMQRDVLFALMSVNAKEDAEYNAAFRKNLVKARKVVKMKKALDKGELGDSHIEKMYKEFVENGGVTGYTTIKSNEEWEAGLRKYIVDKTDGVAKAWRGFADVMEKVANFGEAIEQMTRFAAYMTSRENGKDIKEAVNDAKELTVNFNRKGSGQAITFKESAKLRKANGKRLSLPERLAVVAMSSLTPYGRRFIMFFNASVQALNNMVKLYKNNPRMMSVWTAGYIALGAMNAVLHSLFDDDDDYLDIPDWERRNNLLLGYDGTFFKWALPQEARVFYGLGDMIVNHALGREPNKNIVGEVASMAGEAAPVDFPSGIGAFMPSLITPIWEIVRNEDYKGARVYNEQRYMSDEQKRFTPRYMNALPNTGRGYIGLSKILNDLTGGDMYEAGSINIDPNMVEHLLEGYSGGAGTAIEKVFQFAEDAVNGEFNVRNTPFLRRILTVNDERSRNTHTTELYYYYKGQAENTKSILNRALKNGDGDKLDEIYGSDKYEVMKIFNSYKNLLKYYDEEIKSTDDKAERRELMREQDALRKEMIQEISNIGKK